LNQYAKFDDTPILPTGSAFCEYGWCATSGEVNRFARKAQELGLEGVNFWEWAATRNAGLWPVVRDFTWEGDAPVPPPVDCCEELSTKLDNFINGYAEDYQELDKDLSTLEGELDSYISSLTQAVLDINKNTNQIHLDAVKSMSMDSAMEAQINQHDADITSLQSNVNLCNIGIAELAKRIEYNYNQQVLDANGLEDRIEALESKISDTGDYFEDRVKDLYDKISGLEGGHNHPKIMYWLGLVK